MKKLKLNTNMKNIKYWLIRAQATITRKSVVTFFGTSYIVAGKIVRRFGG